MVKIDSIGMLDVAKLNPVITSNADVSNYSFITVDGDLYLIANTIVGDDSYRENVVIPAGEHLNGYLVKAWEGQKLVVDLKHVTGETANKDAILVAGSDGKLTSGSATGVYFKVTDVGVTLTGKAVKVKVMVAA